jgi:transposase
VPEGHFPAGASVVLMVDRYSAYKAMAQVKAGNILLAFCWSHVRRDFVKVGKGWPEHKKWAVAWLRRIRGLYRYHPRRRDAQVGSAEYSAADTQLRKIVAEMEDQAVLELADPKLPTPCRKALESLQAHWTGLTLFLDDLRIPLDNNYSERQARGPALGRKNYYGSGAKWSGDLAAMLFSLFATLKLAKINARQWLTWYLESCAESGGQTPPNIDLFLPWNMSPEKRCEMTLEPDDSS